MQGALRRYETNYVYDFDQYLQAQWDPAARWRLIAGVRNSLVDVTSHGHLAVIDAADSEVRYSAVNPVAGVTYRATDAVNIYASYGKGFETPTLERSGLSIGRRQPAGLESWIEAGAQRQL